MKGKGEPAHVYISFAVMDIDHIDDERLQFSIQLYIGERWTDYRLNLSSFFEGHHSDEHIFPSYLKTYLWEPDLVFDNTRDGKLFPLSLPNTVIKAQKEGSFRKSSRYNLIVGCHMNFYFYPLDTQECYVKMATLANPDQKVLLHWIEEKQGNAGVKSVQLMYPIKPLKYELRDPEVYKATERWGEDNYTYLYANFTFVRRLSASVFNVYIPTTLIVLLSWISFWIDIEAVPARVTLGVTSLLTLGTQVVQARSGLPSISYMTAMDVWLFACLITVFFVLLEFALAYQMYLSCKQHSVSDVVFERKKSGNVKDFEMKVLRSRLGQDLALRKVNNGKNNSESATNSYKSNVMFIDKLCRKLFPCTFILFSLIYWIYFLHLK